MLSVSLQAAAYAHLPHPHTDFLPTVFHMRLPLDLSKSSEQNAPRWIDTVLDVHSGIFLSHTHILYKTYSLWEDAQDQGYFLKSVSNVSHLH